MAEKQYAAAGKAYDAALGVARSSGVLIKVHAAYSAAGLAAQADSRALQWLKQTPEDRAVRLYLADASLKSGNYKQAIDQYEQLRSALPDNVLILNNLAWAYQQVKNPKALETAERAFKLKSDNAAIADTYGWLLVEKGELGKGITTLQKAVELAPKSQDIRYHLAQAFVRNGDQAKAVVELERILASGVKFQQESEAAALLKSIRK